MLPLKYWRMTGGGGGGGVYLNMTLEIKFFLNQSSTAVLPKHLYCSLQIYSSYNL
jgi:hypothetical protein